MQETWSISCTPDLISHFHEIQTVSVARCGKKLCFMHRQTDSMHTLNKTSVLRKKKIKNSNDGVSLITPHPRLICPIPEQSSKQQPLQSLEVGLKCYLITLLGAVKQ